MTKQDKGKGDKQEKKPSKTKVERKCKICRFKIRNLCHRFPPAIASSARGAGFPRVMGDDECGEFRALQEEKDEEPTQPE